MVHASSSFLPNIIKICLRESKLWSAQDFGIRGGNCIIKKVRVVTLACDMPIGPPLHFYKTLLKYVLGYQSYIEGDNYITKKKVRVVSLACDTPPGPPLHPYQILS